MSPDTPDDEPIHGAQDDGLESVRCQEIGRRTKGQIGALIFAAGDVNLNVYAQTPLESRREAVETLVGGEVARVSARSPGERSRPGAAAQ